MPNYDYQCIDKECNHIFEVFLEICELDEVSPKCPKCKSETKRIISGGSGFILGGEGWSSDGYSDKIEVKDKEKI